MCQRDTCVENIWNKKIMTSLSNVDKMGTHVDENSELS